MGIWSTLSSNKYIQDIYIYIYLRIHYKVTGRVSRCRKYSTMRRSNLSSSGLSFPWALGKRLCLSSRLTLQCIFTHVSYIIPIFTLPAILENTQKVVGYTRCPVFAPFGTESPTSLCMPNKRLLPHPILFLFVLQIFLLN